MSTPSVQPQGALRYKPDWGRAQDRWRAFWTLSNTDRPLLGITAPLPHPAPAPVPASWQAKWMDPDFIVRAWNHQFASTWLGGETVPSSFFMGGYALGCGPNVGFAEHTIWHPVLMRSIRDPIGYAPGPQDPWTQQMEAVVRRLLQESPGNFLVGHVGQVMANDLLYLLRGGQDFLFDLANDIELCVRRLEEILELWCASHAHFRNLVETPTSGCTYGWPGLWRDRFFTVTQSDISCMISPAMFRRYSLHELAILNDRGLDPIWYHVDGPKAYRHIPALLDLPFMKILQLVPGDGAEPNGPAWIDTYRRIQQAGRGLDLDCPWEQLEYLVRHLRPAGVVLRSVAPSVEAGQEFIANAARWAGSHAG